jgi:hypothetical protein
MILVEMQSSIWFRKGMLENKGKKQNNADNYNK